MAKLYHVTSKLGCLVTIPKGCRIGLAGLTGLALAFHSIIRCVNDSWPSRLWNLNQTICVFDRIVRRRCCLIGWHRHKRIDPMPWTIVRKIKHRLTVEIFNDSLAISTSCLFRLCEPWLGNGHNMTTVRNPVTFDAWKITISNSIHIHGRRFGFWWGILTLRTRVWRRLRSSGTRLFRLVWARLLTCLTAWRRYRKGWHLLSLWMKGMPSKNGTTTKKRHTRNCKNWRYDLMSHNILT